MAKTRKKTGTKVAKKKGAKVAAKKEGTRVAAKKVKGFRAKAPAGTPSPIRRMPLALQTLSRISRLMERCAA